MADQTIGTRTTLRRRLLWSTGLAIGAVVGATVLVPSYGDAPAGGTAGARSGSLVERYVAERTAGASLDGPGGLDHGDGHLHIGLDGLDQTDDGLDELIGGDGHAHDHNDPTTKNAISRSDDGTAATADPTSAAERAVAVDAVRAQRQEPDPELRPLAERPDRREAPEDRYAMASGCYALESSAGQWVATSGSGFAAIAERRGAEPFHFQATDLGQYLLFISTEAFLAEQAGLLGSAVAPAAAPSEAAEWVVRQHGGGESTSYTFTNLQSSKALTVADDGTLTVGDDPERFRPRLTDSCADWPEIATNMRGRTFRGVSEIQEVRGYVDAHTHGMAFEFLGGEVHCGRPWHPYGVTYALKDCEDHTYTGGYGAVLESFLSKDYDGHDPVGWPTFKDWPAPHSLTHEGTYWKWMERAWRGGLRVFTNLLVENNKLCQLYPLKRNSCDEMDSVRLQAKRMRQFQDYIDAQYGGPGEGWYRIVTNPFQARRVINEGKLAVVMGIETSIPFHCTMKADVPQCDAASIEQALAEMHRMGVRQMELVNKFDNALAGVAGDEGETGVLVNSANFLETGSFWAMEHCEPEIEGAHDREQYAAPTISSEQQDALFGAIVKLTGNVRPVPAYNRAPHCNQRGLTDLGEHLIREMVDRGMIFDPDHMSVSARKSSLDLLEKLDYSGVISSHSWSTPDAYPRIYRLGGTITPYAGDSTGFVEKWRRHVKWADPRYYFGIGYGADMNGLGAQGDPRGADVANPVTYPFEALGGVTVLKQRSGQRVYDINVDGVSHYGLYPDWIEDLQKVAGADGAGIAADMARGAEAYLQMWERAVGVSNDACRDARALRPVAAFRGLPDGASARQVLRAVGQPHSRLGRTFTYCAERRSGKVTRIDVQFDSGNRLNRVH